MGQFITRHRDHRGLRLTLGSDAILTTKNTKDNVVPFVPSW
jgi:hypothetical protein